MESALREVGAVTAKAATADEPRGGPGREPAAVALGRVRGRRSGAMIVSIC